MIDFGEDCYCWHCWAVVCAVEGGGLVEVLLDNEQCNKVYLLVYHTPLQRWVGAKRRLAMKKMLLRDVWRDVKNLAGNYWVDIKEDPLQAPFHDLQFHNNFVTTTASHSQSPIFPPTHQRQKRDERHTPARHTNKRHHTMMNP